MISPAIRLFGKMLAFSRLQINTQDITQIRASLESLTLPSDVVPVVLDVLDDVAVDDVFFETLIDLLWQKNIAVIAVMDGLASEFAKARKMAVLPNDGKRIARLSDKLAPQSDITANTTNTHSDNTTNQPSQSVVATKTTHLESSHLEQSSTNLSATNTTTNTAKNSDMPSLVYEQMLRSGQSVHHIGGDLIITNSVNKGAEVVTDNNLHIYGKGQGRLVAGATGDEQSRIFCQVFEPSLVSVAGTYCLYDDIPADFIGKAVQVTFDKDKGLVFKLMSAAF